MSVITGTVRDRPLLLLLDSDETAREIYSRWFFAEGFGVVCAGGRDGLLHVLRRESSRLVVSELRVRDLHLSQVVTYVDSFEATRLIPILALTSQPSAISELSRAVAARVSVLPKYCDFDLLRGHVRQLGHAGA